MTKVSMIVAIGPNNVIGYKNKLAWHSKIDLKHFQTMTQNKPVLFGLTTFEGLPKYPLSNRLNVVLDNSQKEDITADNRGWVTCNSFECALLFCENYDEVFICGGKSIYEYVLKHNFVDCIYLTKINCPLEDRDDYIKFPIDINTFCNYQSWDAKLIETLEEDDKILEFWTYIKK